MMKISSRSTPLATQKSAILLHKNMAAVLSSQLQKFLHRGLPYLLFTRERPPLNRPTKNARGSWRYSETQVEQRDCECSRPVDGWSRVRSTRILIPQSVMLEVLELASVRLLGLVISMILGMISRALKARCVCLLSNACISPLNYFCPLQIAKKPMTLAPAVASPHLGTSYNPPDAAHQELILKAHAAEEKRTTEESKLNELKEKMSLAKDGRGGVEGMIVDTSSDERDNITEITQETDTLVKKTPARKTKKEKRKAQRIKEEVKTLFLLLFCMLDDAFRNVRPLSKLLGDIFFLPLIQSLSSPCAKHLPRTGIRAVIRKLLPTWRVQKSANIEYRTRLLTFSLEKSSVRACDS
jgi:hypothetical protein